MAPSKNTEQKVTARFFPKPRGPRTMIDKPRRPWFQIHLSTAIVLMFVAGGLIKFSATFYRYALDYYTFEGDSEPLFPWVRPVVVALLVVGSIGSLHLTTC